MRFSIAKIRLSVWITVRLWPWCKTANDSGMNRSWSAPLGDDAAVLRTRLISYGILNFELVLESILILGCSIFMASALHGLLGVVFQSDSMFVWG